ncbi:hypothetical protein MLD38_034844 [Melastoma candidum]|uniref:Uncharacterized protein n=1 Tax=Melastoma candidum TaxID=119954 RepID=A0ACB9MDE9_9MYRT|nr:hypothetical protein MLD38_034844 [Melastoma candidum]
MNAGRTPNPITKPVDSPPILLPRRCTPSSDDRLPARSLILNHRNFTASASPSRILYFLRDSWVDFPAPVVDSLRRCFLDGRPAIDLRVGHAWYLLDFARMLQFEFESGNCRSIAWIDAEGKCFFPKEFASQEFEHDPGWDLDVEVEVGVDLRGGGDVRVEIFGGKRKRVEMEGRKWGKEEEEEEEEEVSSYYKHDDSKRRCLDLGSKRGKSKWGCVRSLNKGESAYVQVRDFFLSAMKSVDPGATITGIHQYVRSGCMERARYENFHRQLDIVKTARGTPNVVYAWHGTSAENVSSILAYGFGLLSDASKQGGCGIGVYFSPVQFPQLSAMHAEPDDTGEKHIILCRVILGKSERVLPGCKQSHPSCQNFDSGVDDPSNPKQYVLWFSNVNNCVLPECVVSFKPSDTTKGGIGGNPHRKSRVAELFAKLRRDLPPTKIKEVENLYRAFRAGQLAKDSFVKQIRSIAGDEMLLSTIREIRDSA